MKHKTQFEKDNEAFTTNDGYIVLDGVFPKQAYAKDISKIE